MASSRSAGLNVNLKHFHTQNGVTVLVTSCNFMDSHILEFVLADVIANDFEAT